MLTAWPFTDFRTRLDGTSQGRATAGDRRLVLSGIPDGAGAHFGALISDVPLQPSWRGVVTDRIDIGHLSLPELGSIGVFVAADGSRLESVALHVEATDLVLCCDSEFLMDIDRVVPFFRPLRRLDARGVRISVAVIGLGAPEPRYRQFLDTLAAARSQWPVYRVARQDPRAARLTTRMMLHAPLKGAPTADGARS